MTQVTTTRAPVQPWTEGEEEVLRQMVSAGSTRFEIAQRLGRNIESVAGKVQYLGLCKKNAVNSLPGEIWKTTSRNADYEVSNLGRIRNKSTLREMKLPEMEAATPSSHSPMETVRDGLIRSIGWSWRPSGRAPTTTYCLSTT